MKPISAEQLRALIARRVDCQLIGDPHQIVGPDVVYNSQAATAGSLFVAIPGERHDGHDFAADAVAAGAAAVLVDHQLDIAVPQLVVQEPVQGLSALAAGIVADQIACGALTTFALTGSSGKTSTKDLLGQVLASQATTVSPVGNLNNEIGLPATACRVDAQTRYLVSEMGARYIGDIKWLCEIVPPKIAAVLNIGVAHLGEFGSRDNIALAKGEIFDELPPDGWAVLNAQDDFVDDFRSRVRANTQAKIASWAVDPAQLPADELVLVARDLVADDLDRYRFTIEAHLKSQESLPESSTWSPGDGPQRAEVQLQVVGRVQVANALAAATMALVGGVPLGAVAAALGQAVSVSAWRMAVTEVALPDGEAVIINDAYNANPSSMRAALQTLANVASKRAAQQKPVRAIAVLGDMLELGARAAQIHREIGALAAQLDVAELYAVGDFAAEMVAGFVDQVPARAAQALARDEVASRLDLRAGDIVLIKASRGLQLEKVAEHLLAEHPQSDESRRPDAAHSRGAGHTIGVAPDHDKPPATPGNGEDPSA